jgi:hypothetical protein
MWFFSSQASPGTRVSLGYITVGALIVVWTGVWFWYLRDNPPETSIPYYFSTGCLVTGFVLLIIGFGVGAIARGSRAADATTAQASGNSVVASEVAAPPAVAVQPPPVVRVAPNGPPAAAAAAPPPAVARRG